MDQKKIKNNKGKYPLSTLNSKNIFSHKTTKKIVEDIIITNNHLKVNNSNKSTNTINVVKQYKNDKKSPIQSNIKNERQNTDKNILTFTKTIDNSINNYNDNDYNLKKYKQKKIKSNIHKIALNNKFIRTFSGCGKKRKCSLNNKGTFNTSENKGNKNVVRNYSKDKDKIDIRKNLLSNDIEVIKEFNSSNLNNYNSNKNSKFNTIMAMSSYQKKDKDKLIKKINKEELYSNKKKRKVNNSKQNTLKSKYNLKYKEEISINDNRTEIINNNLKDKDKSSKKFNGKKLINKNNIQNNINSTIDESLNSDKKTIKIHKIDSFKQKNDNKNNNNINNNKEKGIQEEQNQINFSVEFKDNKKTINNNSNKSNYLLFNNNQMGDIINTENKRIYKINNYLKKSLNKIMNTKQKENSNKTNLNDNKTINNISKSKKGKSNNNKEIKINKFNTNINSTKKGTINNIRTVSSIQNLKNENNYYNKYIKINEFSNYFKDKYSTMSNRINLALNSGNGKKNYNNIKYSLIRNIKSQLVEDNIFNNLLFILNIISNWGNKKHLGITEIEIFDINNQKIKIKECKVEGGNNEHIERLYNDKIYTINENDMWLLDINNNNKSKNILNIKLYFYIYNYINLESINNINIWNYNGGELNKGIKKIELLTKDEEVIYHGIVPKGEYNTKCFHPYKIRINKNLLLKRNKNKIYKNTHLLYNCYKYDLFPSFDLNSLSYNNSIINKNSKKKLKNKNTNLTLMKQSSLNNTRMVNKLNFIKVKTSRSCHKDKNYYSFINNVFKRKINFSENKNKECAENKFNSTKKYKNHSFFSENQNYKFRGNSEIKKFKFENIHNYSISNTNFEENNSLKNVKSFESFNYYKQDIYNFKTINTTKSKNMLNKKIKNSKQKDNNIQNNKNIKYIYFKKIRIKILTNYGNSYMVGLTGLNLIDKDNKVIDIKCAETVGALPKDLKTIYSNENEFRIFENLFNDENNTINENFMWLTLLIPKPFIEICFKEKMSLSKIEIWNYNDPLGLDKGAKDIEIILDDDENKHYNIMLWKGLGIDYYDYYQKIEFNKLENNSNINYLKLKNINLNNNKEKLPIGFVFKLIFISNFGDKEMISLKKFELYNEKNNLLSNYIIINDLINENYSINNSNKNILKNNNNESIKNFFYHHRLFDFRKDEDSICNNLLFICFNDIVQIKYIKLENSSNEKLKYTSTKYLQIYCDDILIFEGELKQKGENIILFKEKEIKKFNNVININKKKEKNKFVEKIKGGVYRLVNVGS